MKSIDVLDKKIYPNGADLELIVDAPTINAILYDAQNGNWLLELWVHDNKKVQVRHSIEKGFESLGEIFSGADVTDKGIELYIKASKNPLGKGELKGQMLIYVDNPKFEDGVQVIKTFECEIGIRIV